MTTGRASRRTGGREAGELAPDHGARLVLELLEGSIGEARYRVRVETRDERSGQPSEASATATIRSASDVELSEWDHALAPWVLETVLGHCRTLGKNHAAHGDWPGVLRRWRAPRE